MNTNGIVKSCPIQKNNLVHKNGTVHKNGLAQKNGTANQSNASSVNEYIEKDGIFVREAKSGEMDVLIRHIIIEMNKCMFDQLNDPSFLEESLIQMTNIMNTDVKSKATYKFKPQGVTSMLIIGASHISIHTWPEYEYADIDLVVCTKDFEMEDIIAYLNERFGTEDVRYMEIQRGIFA